MKRKYQHLLISALAVLSLTSCAEEPIVKSPCEDGGMEGNASLDTVDARDSAETLKNMLLKVAKIQKYSYEITADVIGNESHFTDYFTPFAWYEETGDPDTSFGYAMTREGGYMFKYYLGEDGTIYPSIYEYAGFSGEIAKVPGLYSPVTLTSLSLLESSMDDFSAVSTGVNTFLITDSVTASVFQYMTTFGSSITNYLTGVSIEILDEEACTFRAVCDLGNYGAITALYTPLEETRIDEVNRAAESGELVGVDYYDDTYEFFAEKMAGNNFVLEGIKQEGSMGTSVTYPYTIHCTNDYFYLSYNAGYEAYQNYGFVLVPKDTAVTYYETDDSGAVVPVTQSLPYDACYGFAQSSDGEFYLDSFVGPNSTSGLSYLEVDALPETGETGILYIVKGDSGEKLTYEWTENTDGTYSYTYYSTWPDTVGDFYIDNSSATFYLSGTALTSIGAMYFEKDRAEENTYYSVDSAITGTLASGLFGWGFQATTTWMSYVTKANLTLRKSGDEITEADIGLSVTASVNGSERGEQKIYYTVKDFGQGNVPEVESFLERMIGE